MTAPNYYLLALGVILAALILMVVRFEGKKPRAREIVLLAVMTALAVAGRTAFFMLPQFKPLAAVVIITGVTLGAESGFLVGVMSAFVSNFIFGQGPWTPFQMLAFGLVGLVAGLLFYRRGHAQHSGLVAEAEGGEVVSPAVVSVNDVATTLAMLARTQRMSFARTLMLSVYGGLSVLVMYGLIVDILYMLMFSESASVSTLFAVLVSGLPFNAIHGASTAFFLVVLAPPMTEKLTRIKLKFNLP
ncbi:MAG: ECF transporter S component [Coriobacteriales bacterium]|jgi:energy-coupling factor transport system substrate-specific component|nr:ECF transporter S component [Coriobacteriales bacterium]